MTGHKKHQSGIAIIVALIILLILTLIMITALRVTTLEEKMSSNSQNHNIAFQAAESALREAEAYINSGAVPFNPLKLSGAPFRDTSSPHCVNGLCNDSEGVQSDAFPDIDGTMITATTGISPIAAEPQYIIELIRTDPSVDSSRIYATFRVTARGWGGDINSLVELESTYKIHALSFTH